ncbi:MAG: lysostaphin resistance A-like protein [Agathobacter sp.]
MSLNLKRNDNMKPFYGEKKGWNIFLEILLFVGIFFLCSFGQMLVLMPVELVMLFQDPAYLTAIQTGDVAAATQAGMNLVSKDSFMAVSLIAEIAMILIVFGMCALIQKRSPRKLGFTKGNFLKEYGIGLVVGFVLFSVAVLIALVTGSLTFSFAGGGAILILFAIGFMIQGMAEEVLCRGYLMCSVARKYPLWVAILTNSLIFAALHLLNAGIAPLAFVNLILFGIFASIYFVRRGNIWGIGAVHSVWNFVQGNFYGIQVSGNGVMPSVFSCTFNENRGFINGGSFGLEGGIAVTIVLVAGILLMYFEPWKKNTEVPAVESTEVPVVENAEVPAEASVEENM